MYIHIYIYIIHIHLWVNQCSSVARAGHGRPLAEVVEPDVPHGVRRHFAGHADYMLSIYIYIHMYIYIYIYTYI